MKISKNKVAAIGPLLEVEKYTGYNYIKTNLKKQVINGF